MQQRARGRIEMQGIDIQVDGAGAAAAQFDRGVGVPRMPDAHEIGRLALPAPGRLGAHGLYRAKRAGRARRLALKAAKDLAVEGGAVIVRKAR